MQQNFNHEIVQPFYSMCYFFGKDDDIFLLFYVMIYTNLRKSTFEYITYRSS
jgi:hypothetical protein